jgi:ATP/maltotriose-dependent transcriptional regulator MalT
VHGRHGKTIPVTTWLDGIAIPWAWLTLDQANNDPSRFVRYLIAALHDLKPEMGIRTLYPIVAAGLSSAQLS